MDDRLLEIKTIKRLDFEIAKKNAHVLDEKDYIKMNSMISFENLFWLIDQVEKYQSIIDEKHRLQEQLEKGAIKVADLIFAYINKDEDFPHDFEIKAFEEGLYFLQEYYDGKKYNLKRFETYLNGMRYED